MDAETNLDLGEILDGGLQDRGCREIDGVDADMEPMELTTTIESTTTGWIPILATRPCWDFFKKLSWLLCILGSLLQTENLSLE